MRKCKATAFYDILGLEELRRSGGEKVGEGEIKKAYRKLSLLTHPDKNGCEGADEAFKSEFHYLLSPYRCSQDGRMFCGFRERMVVLI